MLISCKSCAAVNFLQGNRSKGGPPHCTICRKVLDLSAPELSRDPKQGFRISHHPVELEKKIDEMNSNQRLAIASLLSSDDYEAVEIEDEEEELLDMSPSIKLPALDFARWNDAKIPSIPAVKRRQRLNQRLTLAAWIFVAGVGTAGAAGVAVASTSKTATTAPAPEKKTATAALAAIAPQQKSSASRNSPR